VAAANAAGTDAISTNSVQEAIECAERDSTANDVIVISGSVYLVGEARALLIGKHGAHE